MAKESRNGGFSRRNFLKTAGVSAAALAAGTAATAIPARPALSAEGPDPMQTRVLGKTGEKLSILCLGGMFDTINNQLLLRQAQNWGVSYWDTAEAYGNGQSEEGYGRYLKRNPDARKGLYISTKLVNKSGSADDLTPRLDKCLERLGLPSVDLFLIHAVASADEVSGKVKDWAAEMKKRGKFRHFGFSTHTNPEECLTGAARMDWVDAIMVVYNFRLMHEAKMSAAFDAAQKAGIGIIAMKTMGGGQVKSDSEAELKLGGHFLAKGYTDKQAKLKAVWNEPRIASLCSQMHNLTILQANVAAAKDKTALSAVDVEALREYAQATACDYCAGCQSLCAPHAPAGAPIHDAMRALMYARDYGDKALAETVLAGLPRSSLSALRSGDFAGAQAACPRGLPVTALMKDAARLA